MKFASVLALVLGVSSMAQAGWYWGRCHDFDGTSKIAAAKAQYEANVKAINETYGTTLQASYDYFTEQQLAANKLNPPESRALSAYNTARIESDKRAALQQQYADAAIEAAHAQYVAVINANTYACPLYK